MACPKCGNQTIITTTVYGDRETCCDLVGWGGKPMQDKRTRERRQEFHKIFDPLWKDKLMSRGRAYNYLANRMKLRKDQVHGALMTYEQLGHAIAEAKVILFLNQKGLWKERNHEQKESNIT